MTDRRDHWPISGINVTVTMIRMLDHDGSSLGSATGFFFRHQNHKYLVTNRHVIIDAAENHFPSSLELKTHNSRKDFSSNNIVNVRLYYRSKPAWHEHPDYANSRVDVVLIPLDKTTLDNENLFLFNHSIINFLSKDNFPHSLQISSFANVIIVGYPLGFSDEKNNLPVYRKGMIASSYPIHFNQSPFFLVDACLHEGTSGGPVLNSSDNVLVNEKGAFHSDFTYLLGIHSAEYVVNEEPLSLCVVWYPIVITEIIHGIVQ